MTIGNNSQAAQLDQLLESALDLEGDARAQFLLSDAVPVELREELAELLKAADKASPLELPLQDLHAAAAELYGLQEGNPVAMVAGQGIGRYRLSRLLGEGGMATVWLAERDDATFSHQVALKCLKTGLATPDSRVRFLREQQILAQLQHPNIARLYDAGLGDDGVPFIVMEWVDGLSLARYCDERRLGLAARLAMFRKVCAAVAYAHQNLIVHRDLKPANILVGVDGEPKLLDFGIAKLLDENEQPLTRTGFHPLTPEYAAPEQFSGALITTATDVFSLGVVLYELLCGLRPRQYSRKRTPTEEAAFDAPSDAMRRLLGTRSGATQTADPVQLADSRASVPDRLRHALRGDLDTIVMTALQAEPARRYPTVLAFSDDIGRYLQQQPIGARRDAWSYRMGKFLRRHVVGVTVGVVVFALLLAATVISIRQEQLARSETRRAQIEAQRAETEARRALAVQGFLTNLFEVSDSGSPRDKMPSTETLLQDGAKRIRGEFNDAPVIKFDLLLLLGRVQRDLGEYDAAEGLLREARTIADASFSPDNDKWLLAHTEWAKQLVARSQLAAAQDELNTAISRHRRVDAKDSPALAGALAVLGNVYQLRDHLEPAIAVSKEALAMSRRLFTGHDPRVQNALEELGITLLFAQHFAEAEAMERANVALSRELYGEHQASYARALTALAYVLRQERKDAEVERLARQALAILDSVYDRPNYEFERTLSALGDALYFQGKLDEAEAVYERNLAISKQLDPSNTPQQASALGALGSIALDRHQYPEAERLQREVLAMERTLYGPRHGMEIYALQSLGAALDGLRRYPEAIAALQEALAMGRSLYGNNSEPEGLTLVNLAHVHMDSGHSELALEDANQALAIFHGKSLAADSPRLLEAELIQARALDHLARHVEARALLQAMIMILRSAGAPQRVRLAESLVELGRAEQALGEPANALGSWNEALALDRAAPTPDKEALAELGRLIASARKTTGAAVH